MGVHINASTAAGGGGTNTTDCKFNFMNLKIEYAKILSSALCCVQVYCTATTSAVEHQLAFDTMYWQF
jgi:hypothetical protein